ncbi:nitrogen regulation protein NR(II) [Candidatus Omnitrophota bacterium]
MINVISGLDLICVFAILISFFLLSKGWKRRLSKAIAFFFAALLFVTLIRAIGDFLDWSGISNFLSRFEEYLEILAPLLWGFLFYAFLQTHTEQTLRDSEENLSVTLDSMAEGVIVTDMQTCILRLNPAAREILRIKEKEVIGLPLFEIFNLVHSETRQKLEGFLNRVMKEGRVVGFAQEGLLIAHDGAERIIADSSAPILDNNGKAIGVVIVIQDITEQHFVAEQLRHSQKMKAIGQLAGGIAHDFNNLCTGINNYSELLDRCVHGDKKASKYVANIKNCTNQAADLTRMLLAFARKGKLEEKPVNIHNVISEVIGILQHTLPSSIFIECELKAKHPYTLGDYAQLENAILNIALNARDAMPKGGTLTFATSEIELDKEYSHKHNLAITSGVFLQLSISDTGEGISDEVKEHIFEPFFTTKNIDKGTGLGLASVYGTIKNHQGGIDVVSSIGDGATFILYLPLLEKEKEY